MTHGWHLPEHGNEHLLHHRYRSRDRSGRGLFRVTRSTDIIANIKSASHSIRGGHEVESCTPTIIAHDRLQITKRRWLLRSTAKTPVTRFIVAVCFGVRSKCLDGVPARERARKLRSRAQSYTDSLAPYFRPAIVRYVRHAT